MDQSRWQSASRHACHRIQQQWSVSKLEILRGDLVDVLYQATKEQTEYLFNTRSGHHAFCKHCGARPYSWGHIAAIGGDYVSINVNTLDGIELKDVPVTHWDGRHNNWDAGPRPQPWPILAA